MKSEAQLKEQQMAVTADKQDLEELEDRLLEAESREFLMRD